MSTDLCSKTIYTMLNVASHIHLKLTPKYETVLLAPFLNHHIHIDHRNISHFFLHKISPDNVSWLKLSR